MRNNILLKLVIVAFLGLAFLVPLTFIWGVVSERARYRDRVVSEVAQSSATDQQITGPILAVRYRERVTVTTGDEGKRESKVVKRLHILLPDSLVTDSDVRVESRKKGIYEVPVFRAANAITASFNVPPRFGIEAARELVGEPVATLAVGVSDARGLRNVSVSAAGAPLEVEPGSSVRWLKQGFSVPLTDLQAGERFDVHLDVELLGTRAFGLLPIGKTTRVTMTSDWPHPGFEGGFLPDERSISSDGFEAAWSLSRLATGVDDAIAQLRDGDASAMHLRDLSVRFVQPVDVYQQSERAVKYGILFVLLTFVAFFLYEVLRGLQIHPVQYAMCAAGLVMFFLLVVSLSEHVPFGGAYLLATAACVGLITFYVIHVLGSLVRGLGFGAMLGALYAFLYVILQSEDFALLLGTLLLFAVLGTIMVITRRIDWYGLGQASSTRAIPEQPAPPAQ